MAKFHVNPNTGNSGACKSTKGKCPFGSEEEHFDNVQDATNAAEKLMAENHSTVKTAYRKKDNSALEGMNREMKKRIISEAASGESKLHPSVVAKVFSKDNDELIRKNVSESFKSQKILREMSNDESARVRLAVAKATNNPEVLKAFAKDPDSKVRNAALENKNVPVKIRKATLDAIKKQRAENLKKNLADKPNLPKEEKLVHAKELSRSEVLASIREATETLQAVEADREKLKLKYANYDIDNETVAQAITRNKERQALDSEYNAALAQRKEYRAKLESITMEKNVSAPTGSNKPSYKDTIDSVKDKLKDNFN